MTLPPYTSSTQLYCSICTKEMGLSEKPQQKPSKNYGCCGRSVCGECIYGNPRFGIYCTFCQSIVKVGNEGLVSFRPLLTSIPTIPSYKTPSPESFPAPGEILHYIRRDDTVFSLSLLYKIPVHVIRSHNRLFSDHLLQVRRTIEIPSSFYSGPSLSHPLGQESEESEAKKSVLKRFQLKTKCLDFVSAEVYLEQATWDEELAAENWMGDEKWVAENPMVKSSTGKGWKENVGRGAGGG